MVPSTTKVSATLRLSRTRVSSAINGVLRTKPSSAKGESKRAVTAMIRFLSECLFLMLGHSDRDHYDKGQLCLCRSSFSCVALLLVRHSTRPDCELRRNSKSC